MLLDRVPWTEISKVHLQQLIEEQVEEGQTIDYKADLALASPEQKKSLLVDASAFANTEGGYIVYGVTEENGLPVALCGVGDPDADALILRLQQVLDSGVSPRIPGIEIRRIALENDRAAILMRIPTSWAKPHMVCYNQSSKFYARRSNGNCQLDVDEIREAFLLSDRIEERMRRFRDDRLVSIAAGETPVPLPEGARLVLHLYPVTALTSRARLPLGTLISDPDLAPMYARYGFSHRFNLDGLLHYQPTSSGHSTTYTQLFSDGRVEAVDTGLLSPLDLKDGIPMFLLDNVIVDAIHRYTRLLAACELRGPVGAMLSLMGVKNRRCIGLPRSMFNEPHQMDRDPIRIPAVIVEGAPFSDRATCAQALRMLLDSLWNAADWDGVQGIDLQNRWVLGLT